MATPSARSSLPGLAILSGLCVWGALRIGPILVGDQVQALPALLAGFAVVGGLRLAVAALLAGARGLEWLSAHAPTGRTGTAQWATAKDLRRERSRRRHGPFWGLSARGRPMPLFIDYASNALTVAPAGSGKGLCTVVPNGLSIRASKVFADFKGELACILKPPLQRRGERVRVLNPGGLWRGQLGEGDCFNPVDLIAGDLHRPGGLRDVPDDLRELAAQLLPEPGQSDGENTYFREGSRRILAMVLVLEAMIEGYDASLASVALLIEDRAALEHHLRWVVGVDLDGQPLAEGRMPIEHTDWAGVQEPEEVRAFARLVRAWAGNLLALMTTSDGRTFESFLSRAQQAIAPFAFGRLAPAMGRSTFRMEDLKEGRRPTSLFLVADASRMEAYRAWLGLIQWCALTAIKRHPCKARPVYLIADECTNYRIAGLEALLTWGRAYGLRLHLIFQDLSAFERVYGKPALETLLSETEIKQFLPGQRAPKTLELIAKALGEQSLMAASLSRDAAGLREQTSEAPRPLMTPDELRRTSHGVLLVRRARPALIAPISYGQVHPWRRQAGINPFHGQPFRRKVRLTL